MVEVELARHSFYSHIFPQITKFFSFFNNAKSLSELVEKIFVIVNNDTTLRTQFVKYLGNTELFKSIKDVIEDSQKILLIIDEKKKELPEIIETYTDTWGKMVNIVIVKTYKNNDSDDAVIVMEPDFEVIDVADDVAIDEEEDSEVEDEPKVKKNYDEDFHLKDVNPNVKEIYYSIKNKFQDVKYNVQKYYISMVEKTAFTYIVFRKKKVRLVVTMPYAVVKEKIKYNKVKEVSEGVKRFYNAECCHVFIEDNSHLDEIYSLLTDNKNFKIIKKR